MAQVEWPTRRVKGATIAGIGGVGTYSVSVEDRDSMATGRSVIFVNGNSRSTAYIQPAAPGVFGYRLSTDEAGGSLITVPSSFDLEMDAAIITNYPARPMLIDPGHEAHTTVSNPLQVRNWTQGEPRYQGSVQIESATPNDVAVVEAFIDQLYTADNWFELPLPGTHLGAHNVTAYDAATRTITIPESGSVVDTNIQGWFGRVGARTVRVISDTRNGTNHQIRIEPPLITGTTAQAQANTFSNQASVRVRAESVTANGTGEFHAAWTIRWVETQRTD